MNFTSSPPANFTIIICDLEVRYVKNGDIISHDNRTRIFDITTCLASRLLEWSRKIRLLR